LKEILRFLPPVLEVLVGKDGGSSVDVDVREDDADDNEVAIA
jgi:hypothetical protein